MFGLRTVEHLVILAAAAVISGCASAAELPVSAGIGSQPTLPAPKTSAIPLVKVTTARGWSAGQKPVAAEGTTLTAFAEGLEHPRWLYVLPNGDVLVAETNGPARPEDNKGIRGKIFKHYYAKAGSAVPSPNRITLLRDADGDGVAEMRSVFASGLNSPFGMALVGDVLYVADTDALVKLPYSSSQTQVTASPVKVVDLPAGPLNHHWTKNVVASPDGSKLYVAVGSNSTSARTASPPKMDEQPSGRSIRRRGTIACSPPVCGTLSGWHGNLRAARCG